jgi:hypothetical protein
MRERAGSAICPTRLDVSVTVFGVTTMPEAFARTLISKWKSLSVYA